MSNGLLGMTGWPTRAADANWCITTLAKNCHVSISTLERHFQEAMRQCPRDWLNDERMRRARELLCDHTSVKETAILLGYKKQHHFSLAFKKHHGYPPSLHLKSPSPLRSGRGQGEVSSLESEIGNRKSEIGNRK